MRNQEKAAPRTWICPRRSSSKPVKTVDIEPESDVHGLAHPLAEVVGRRIPGLDEIVAVRRLEGVARPAQGGGAADALAGEEARRRCGHQPALAELLLVRYG